MRIAHPQRIALTALTAGLGILVTGCGSSPRTSSRPSSDRPGVSQAFQYSECMRAHGVPSFPDPVVRTQPGSQSVAMVVPRTVVASPAFNAARTACQGIMPAPNAAEIAQQQRHEMQGRLAFAQCMRRHGVRSFPDPAADGHLTLAMVHAAGVYVRTPSVLAAAKACVSASGGTITGAMVQQAVAAGG